MLMQILSELLAGRSRKDHVGHHQIDFSGLSFGLGFRLVLCGDSNLAICMRAVFINLHGLGRIFSQQNFKSSVFQYAASRLAHKGLVLH